MEDMDNFLDQYFNEFLLCARYNELAEMKALIDSLKQYYSGLRGGAQSLRIDNDFVNRKDENGNSALHMAAANGHEDLCLYLINDLRVDINCVNTQVNSPLHWAVVNQRTNIVKLLLNLNADRNLTNAVGFTPAMEAQRFNFEEVLSLFLSKDSPDPPPSNTE